MKVTMKQIAKEANVSTATVSHVINGTKHITEEKYKKIMEIINKYNYMPNSTAKNLRQKKTKTAGLIVSSFPDTFITEMVYGVEERAREMGYNLLLINTNEDRNYEEETMNLLYSRMVDGVILSPTSNDIEYLNKFTNEEFPVVLVNRYNDTAKNIPKVTGDNFQTGYDATIHLLRHGHKKIGMIYGVSNVSTTDDRIRGYKEALNQHNIPFNENYMELGHATVLGGAAAVKSLLKRHSDITALFIQNDLMTIGAISQIKESLLNIPEDIALIGFGDFASAPIIDPPVTNIMLPPDIIGRTAFDALLSKINNSDYKKHIELPPSLITRKSCGCK
ncbi:LacI family DNA-binding transcriptional regulator [Halobacillus naozhouensis]|uniref:LacI family DNA-binding transcriptional regulator n=1 Tax=Halobacillus naozhouensis TaxID=554880 RepID=A0ABY8J0F4_9BACI|nr:LacI family DNA-binding transcriptional regulator [Halobacillus naozhouensis]WFT75977.1 LacI family DNA-binding transcriptional regulator [Halobacillus naozhouensis]